MAKVKGLKVFQILIRTFFINVLESKLPSKQRKRRLNIEMSFFCVKSIFIVSYINSKGGKLWTKH